MNAQDDSSQVAAHRACWWPFVVANVCLVLDWSAVKLSEFIRGIQASFDGEGLANLSIASALVLGIVGYVLLPIGVALAKPTWRFSQQLKGLIGLAFLYSSFFAFLYMGTFRLWSIFCLFLLWLIGILLHQLFFLLITNLWIKIPSDSDSRASKITWLMLIEGGIIAGVVCFAFTLVEGLGC